jgi:hypothetical protein
MKNLLFSMAGVMGFITISACVFNNVAFTTTLKRAGIVVMTTLLVGVLGVSFVLLFGYLGSEKEESRTAAGDETSAAN